MSRRATARKTEARNGFRLVKILAMRRSLVLTDESARHPFRATLPPHICRGGMAPASRPSWVISRDDIHGFVGAYFACLAAVAVFIV